jgi:hypothetical protein
MGIVRHVVYYKGWSGSFTIERRDSVLDDYFALLEANFYLGTNQLPTSLTQSILEVSGQITIWRYTGVILKYDDAGAYRGDQTVKQGMSFMASKRLKIA